MSKYDLFMAEKKFWTAADLEKLSPAERAEVVRDGLVSDLSEVPESFLERVRANVRDHIASNASTQSSER